MGTTAPAVSPTDSQRHGSTRDVFAVLFRRKWTSFLFFLVVVALVALGTFTATEVYESEARILLKPGLESLILDAVLPEGRVVSVRRTAEEQVRSELAILESRVLVEKAIDAIGVEKFLALSGVEPSAEPGWQVRLGLAHKEGPRETAIRILMENLTADAVRSANVLEVSFQSPSPELAHEALQTIVDGYLERHVEVFQTGAALAFFERQTEKLRRDLEAAEVALREFKKQANIADLEEQRTRLIARLNDLEAAADSTAARVAAAAARVSLLEGALAQLEPTLTLQTRTGAEYRYMDDARMRLLELKLEERDLLSKYPETSRLVTSVRDRIREAENALKGEDSTRTEVTTGVNTARQELELVLFNQRADLAALRKEQQEMAEHLAALRAQLAALNDHEMQLTRLERQKDIAEKNYRAYAEKLEEARSSKALETERLSNVAVIQPATEPLSPVKPRKTLNLLLGLVLGLVGGIAMAFLSEHLDHSLRQRDQVEKRLGIPVLAAIPKTRKIKTITLRG